MADMEKQGRDKIFDDDKKPVNISGDILRLVAEDAEEKRLYSSQVIDGILRDFYKKSKRMS